MKVGIVTLQGDFNYGNRLQNYAVYKMLKSYGLEVRTIIIRSKEEYLIYQESRAKKLLKSWMPIHLLCFCSFLRKRVLRSGLGRGRARGFRTFDECYIPMEEYRANRLEQLSENKKLQEYEYFFVGSDQVWNSSFGTSELYFLTFVPPEKRIAFIASMGVEEIPVGKEEYFAECLEEMHYISVREEAAARIIKELTGREADCFFDPVLLLGRSEWLKIEEPVPFSVPSKYILSFFLGIEPKEAIEEFADRKNIDVVHMNQKEYKMYYTLNPAQFVYMVRHAEYILTDSFHVTAFSIIFERQFFVFRRREEGKENMFSRLETLLGRLGLMERVQNASNIEEIAPVSQRQYQHIEKMLANERVRLDEKMKSVLKIR